ncbi:hypothetical protein ACRALDRAFT_2016561 [Sodiomyces alcalophilus JCM 7366]|uniref:uncharacterized protein n=1 Tax=Sodiomyces alcalophilus JCM 7366 TaxID=591952 RepID=UPI0039B4A725
MCSYAQHAKYDEFFLSSFSSLLIHPFIDLQYPNAITCRQCETTSAAQQQKQTKSR